MLGFKTQETTMALTPGTRAVWRLCRSQSPAGPGQTSGDPGQVWAVRVPPHDAPIEFCVAFAERRHADRRAAGDSSRMPRAPLAAGSHDAVDASTAKDAYVVDHIALPLDNPWRRNVRPGDIQFLEDGTGVSVTLDGDVWLVRGLHEPAGPSAGNASPPACTSR